MDADRFDRLARSLSVPLESLATAGTRRGVLSTLLGGTLGLLGITAGTARRRRSRGDGITTERCLAIGEKCPKRIKHGRRQVKHTCSGKGDRPGCCTQYAERAPDGKRRCACKSDGASCEANRNCCSQRCTGGVCGSVGPAGCTPTTCATQGKDCGTIQDGCGTQLRCGPDECGNGFSCTANRCLCPDGTAVCQGICCQAGQVCQNGGGPCCTPNCARKCGGVDDGCGGTCTGACDAGRVCLSNGTCAVPCPTGTECPAAGCGNRCIGTNQGNVCSLSGGVGECANNNAGCPTGSACNHEICEPVC
jgi:hypothetical protein